LIVTGFGETAVIAVAVPAALTDCVVLPTLELKFRSPLYVAVTVREPAATDAREQDPVPLVSAIVHAFVPSDTATEPVGTPVNAGFTFTVTE
jgi:hypothetical protein